MAHDPVLWRAVVDWAKRRQWPLTLADRLGRGRGRLRPLHGWGRLPAAKVPDLSRFTDADLAACWLGHATMLYRLGGRTILVDPVFSNRVGLDLGPFALGPRRQQAPALRLSQLPRIDLLLITHAHFDHLDRPTLHRLPKNCEVVTAPGVGDLLDDLGFRHVHELPADSRLSVGNLEVTALATQHWGPRVFFDTHRGYVAFTLAAAGRRRILHTGDTADTRAFDGTGPYDLGAFGIGAYDPYVAAHATPEQAWRMAVDAGCRHLAAYHHTTFQLSREPLDEPLRRLLAVADPQRVVIREVGDVWEVVRDQ